MVKSVDVSFTELQHITFTRENETAHNNGEVNLSQFCQLFIQIFNRSNSLSEVNSSHFYDGFGLRAAVRVASVHV